jgi:hypothetical protein
VAHMNRINRTLEQFMGRHVVFDEETKINNTLSHNDCSFMNVDKAALNSVVQVFPICKS